MRKINVKMTAAILGTALTLTACGGSGGNASTEATAAGSSAAASDSATTAAAVPDKNATYRETLHIAVAQQAPSLDLHKNSSLIARQMMDGTCWEKLVTQNANAEAVPELCESYEVSEDATTITFNLRKGVKFHDGSEMTADDVVASMNRWIEGFSSAKSTVGEARFEKVDDYTVKIAADHSILLLPSMIAGAAQPVPITTEEACAKEDTNGFMTDYIGTGPYKFVEWVQDQYVKLERFDDYVPYGTEGEPMDGWAGYKSAPTKILEYDIVPEATTREAGLETGQYDVIWGVPNDDYERIKALDGVTINSSQAGTVALVFNHKQGIAANQWFRQAVNTCLDMDEILTAVYGEGGYDLGSCYMDEAQAFWNTDAGSEYYNQKNPEAAKKILEENGYNGETFTILVSNLSNMNYMAVAMEAELEAIGIPTELTIVDWATLTDYRKDPAKFDIYITSFAQVPVPSLKLYFGPSYPGWSDDAVLAEKFAAMNTSKTLDEAKSAWEDLQAYSWEYLPLINAGHYITHFAWNSKVEGLNEFSGLYFWNAGIKE